MTSGLTGTIESDSSVIWEMNEIMKTNQTIPLLPPPLASPPDLIAAHFFKNQLNSITERQYSMAKARRGRSGSLIDGLSDRLIERLTDSLTHSDSGSLARMGNKRSPSFSIRNDNTRGRTSPQHQSGRQPTWLPSLARRQTCSKGLEWIIKEIHRFQYDATILEGEPRLHTSRQGNQHGCPAS